MRSSTIREIFFFIIRISLVCKIFKYIYQKRSISIYTLHNPKLSTLEKTLGYLKKNYKTISLQNLIEKRKDIESFPDYSAIVTFDDGFKELHSFAELFKNNNIKPTVFLVSGMVDTNKNFWWTHTSISEKLKQISDSHRIAFLEKKGYIFSKEYPVRHSLNREEIEEMSPYVDFQSHSLSHPILTQCSDDKSFNEIKESHSSLSLILANKINSFAYPNGNYGEREVSALKSNNYLCGLTCKNGFNNKETSFYELNRISLKDNMGLNEAIVRISGFWGFIKNLFEEKFTFV